MHSFLELCNNRESWVDLNILNVDGLSVAVDLTPVYDFCPKWEDTPGSFGYMWMETPCPTLLDCQLYVVGCDQLTENCDDKTLKFPVTSWSGGFSEDCL